MDLRHLIVLISSIQLIYGSAVNNKSNTRKRCQSIKMNNNKYYTLEYQKEINGVPADMNVHWSSGNVFFTLISNDMGMNLKLLNTNGKIDTVKLKGLGQTTTVDNFNNVTYLATDNGIFKYSSDGKHSLYAASNEDVMYVTVARDGDTMYIATYPQNRVHKITNKGKHIESFPAVPNGHGLTIDAKNNIYFVATKTPYVLQSGNNLPIIIKGLPQDKTTGVYVASTEEVFAMDENSRFYKINGDEATAKSLGAFNLTGVNTFALDGSNNVLVGVKDWIYKFKSNEKDPCKDRKIRRKKKPKNKKKVENE